MQPRWGWAEPGQGSLVTPMSVLTVLPLAPLPAAPLADWDLVPPPPPPQAPATRAAAARTASVVRRHPFMVSPSLRERPLGEVVAGPGPDAVEAPRLNESEHFHQAAV